MHSMFNRCLLVADRAVKLLFTYINMQRFDCVEGLAAVVYSHVAFFEHAYKLMSALEPRVKELVTKVKHEREAATATQAQLLSARMDNFPNVTAESAAASQLGEPVTKVGYLYEQSTGVIGGWQLVGDVGRGEDG